ncbi:Uu.00g111150.m01.CDS01 [Anthostomella pinea]|uniref:Uu.00g111150.m01.CDS01 n=1 Tax=Anthostomella pinea TaxID=933095 RepID=A0AAI8YGG8_9PEZI|nr:Uu.00g111150.m01.CDS01 [Anthostomella pinea]
MRQATTAPGTKIREVHVAHTPPSAKVPLLTRNQAGEALHKPMLFFGFCDNCRDNCTDSSNNKSKNKRKNSTKNAAIMNNSGPASSDSDKNPNDTKATRKALQDLQNEKSVLNQNLRSLEQMDKCAPTTKSLPLVPDTPIEVLDMTKSSEPKLVNVEGAPLNGGQPGNYDDLGRGK